MAVGELLAWLAGKNIVGTVAAVDSKVAGDFRLQALEGMHPRTANKRLEALRAYWRWLAGLGNAPDNPWIGKSISKRAVKDEAPERPFTDEEVERLFSGGPTWQMRDVMAIAALSGMRLDEIFQLKVVDCADHVFHVRTAKTHAGIRRVPIHPALISILSRRMEGKSQGDYLIEEGTDSGWDGNRSMAFSKRFATYRRSCGIDEVHKGNARSRVNFHSFRRWFITKADHAGLREQDVARTVGHKVQSMSFGRYSGPLSLERLRAVVESVAMPSGVVLDSEAQTAKPKVVLRRKPLARQKLGRKARAKA
jgi:integrase